MERHQEPAAQTGFQHPCAVPAKPSWLFNQLSQWEETGHVRQRSLCFTCLEQELSGRAAPFEVKMLITSKLRDKTSDQMVAQNHQTLTVGDRLLPESLEKYCTAAACQSSWSLDLEQALGYSSDSADDDHCAVLFQMH